MAELFGGRPFQTEYNIKSVNLKHMKIEHFIINKQ